MPPSVPYPHASRACLTLPADASGSLRGTPAAAHAQRYREACILPGSRRAGQRSDGPREPHFSFHESPATSVDLEAGALASAPSPSRSEGATPDRWLLRRRTLQRPRGDSLRPRGRLPGVTFECLRGLSDRARAAQRSLLSAAYWTSVITPFARQVSSCSARSSKYPAPSRNPRSIRVPLPLPAGEQGGLGTGGVPTRKRSDDLARQERGPADKGARWREASARVDKDLALAEELEAVGSKVSSTRLPCSTCHQDLLRAQLGQSAALRASRDARAGSRARKGPEPDSGLLWLLAAWRSPTVSVAPP